MFQKLFNSVFILLCTVVVLISLLALSPDL